MMSLLPGYEMEIPDFGINYKHFMFINRGCVNIYQYSARIDRHESYEQI